MAIITDSDLKAHLKITTNEFDTAVSNAVNAANQAVVQYCGRSFDTTAVGSETARVFYPEHRCLAVVHDFWDITNLAVATDEGDDGTHGTTWPDSDFQLEPLNQIENGITTPYYRIRAVEGRTFPVHNKRPSVQVTAAWGWAAGTFDSVFEAALVKGARLFHRKDSPQGVAGFNEFGAVRLTAHDGDVMSLLNPFRRPDETALVG